MDSKPIIFFDSGVGGLPYLALAKERVRREQFIYVADRLHYPYGEKTSSQIEADVLAVFHLIMKRFHPKIAVIACNTASVAALASLRREWLIPFVGVVPAVKPAAAYTKTKRIGVLATPQTVKNDYLDGLIREFADDCEVVRIPAPALRDFVEMRFFDADPEEKRRVVEAAAGAVRASGVDVLVLACTHFLHVAADLHKALGPAVHLIDSRQGVVSQLERVLDQSNLYGRPPIAPDALFLTGSAPFEERYLRFARLFRLEQGGVLS
jgi:glutamate racemase